MLKTLHTFLLLMPVVLVSCSGNSGKSAKQDTVFLEKVSDNPWGQKVYIEPNHNSEKYKQLLNFTFDSNEIASFKESNEVLKQQFPKPFKKHNIHDVPREWVPVYAYKGRYYLYTPGESSLEGRMYLNDSTMITQWAFDGPSARPISSVTKPNDHTWFFKIRNFTEPAPYRIKFVTDTLIIHVIDPKTILSVWEEFTVMGGHRYNLYVPKKYAKKFDMVVNAGAPGNKVPEFAFDKVDYKKLIKGGLREN